MERPTFGLMKRWASIFMLQLATAMLLLHAVVPHVHHAEYERVDACETEDQVSLPSLLKLTFHLTDPGEGHLEHASFQTESQRQEESNVANLPPAFFPCFDQIALFIACQSVPTFQACPKCHPPHIAGWTLRGPPLSC